MYEPDEDFPGGYQPDDGIVEFYGRIRSLLSPGSVVLDLGAGRGAWSSDPSPYRRAIRDLRTVPAEVIAADVDPAVLENENSSCNVMIADGRLPLEDESVDLIVAHYVLEHVEDPAQFVAEVERVLRPGGYFCARTPHRLHYVAIAARLTGTSRQKSVVGVLQPARASEDVFPTVYAMNTPDAVAEAFPGWDNFSYQLSSGPRYFMGKKSVHRVMTQVHRVLPPPLKSNLFVFVRKPGKA